MANKNCGQESFAIPALTHSSNQKLLAVRAWSRKDAATKLIKASNSTVIPVLVVQRAGSMDAVDSVWGRDASSTICLELSRHAESRHARSRATYSITARSNINRAIIVREELSGTAFQYQE
jgi:hypothetical protein